ncbi:hypothetical protein DID73_00205 [Candidatus Marinamargulisbacteria bacterium SCGC AG-343-K17]|nr:hypothetical protein DID73_00205 [Candidatus Marinamargulisbacteria bacterium SCGC AG-343-K17]
MRCYFCLNESDLSICNDCQRMTIPQFQWLPSLPNICMAGYLYQYTPVIQQIIQGVKYQGNFKLGDLIRSSIQVGHIPSLYFETDGYVCVPSHWFRQLFRGRQHIPYLFDVFKNTAHDLSFQCKRHRYARASVGLSRVERLNKKGVSGFSWLGDSAIRSVTILDDVCTTGATLASVARVLKNCGIESVYALVIAHQPLTSA